MRARLTSLAVFLLLLFILVTASYASGAEPKPSGIPIPFPSASGPAPSHFCDACNLVTARPEPSVGTVPAPTRSPRIVLPETDTP